MPHTKPKTINQYIAGAPKEAQKMLRELRAILKKAAPKASTFFPRSAWEEDYRCSVSEERTSIPRWSVGLSY